MPLRIPVLGYLDRRMGDTESGGNQVATNGVHRRIAHVQPLAVCTLPSTILPSTPGALEAVSCQMALPRIPAIGRGSLTSCSTPHLSRARSRPRNKWPTHIVPPVGGALPQAAKPTARNIWNHVRGVLPIPPRSQPHFTDAAPTVEELRWQLKQAVSAAERTWVLEAMARHRHVAPPRKRPREPSPTPAQNPAGSPRESRESHAGPFLEQARQVVLHAPTQAARLCLEEVAQVLARQAITQKSLFLAHHHEHLCRQAYSLHKEHTARWYVQAQQAVRHLSRMADSRQLRFG